MADGTQIASGSGDVLTTDELVTLNGAAAPSGHKAARTKVGFGSDGDYRDVDETYRLPVALPGMTTGVPENDVSAPPVRLVGQDVWNVSFSDVGTTIAPELTTPITGTGVSFSQAASSLLIVAGTTANAEFLTRSVRSWQGSLRARLSSVMGARSANNNFTWMLADLIGEGLSYNIVSATQVDVTLTNHGFTSANVGQFMYMGGITTLTGSAPRIPGRRAIASIPDANTIRFTVSGWASSGTGTCTLFGHSYARVAFEGATATTTTYGTGRRGWSGTADNAATSNLTTASPGAIHTIELTGREAVFFDHLRATTTTPTIAVRATRYEDLPDDNLPLYLFIWSYNGTTGPTSTTWAISFASVEKFANTPVYIQGQRANGSLNPLPVTLTGTNSLAANQTVSVSQIGGVSVAALNVGTSGANGIGVFLGAGAAPSVADRASSAATTTGNTAASVSQGGAVVSANIVFSAVGGTTPTLDLVLQETFDGGTTFRDLWHCERVTANGTVTVPSIPVQGRRRWSWTISGTGPTFTFAINPNLSSGPANVNRRIFDRTANVLNGTLSTATAAMHIDGCSTVHLKFTAGAITTTPGAYQIQLSDDGTNWVNVGSPVTAVASSTVQTSVTDVAAAFARAIVTTGATGQTGTVLALTARG
jgi:hypothetical protein